MYNLYMNFSLIDTIFSSSPIGSVLLGVLILILLALVVLVFVIVQFGIRFRQLAVPEYYRITDEAEHKAEQILKEAQEHSNAIKSRAEDISEKLAMDFQKYDEIIREEHKKHIEDSTLQAKELLSKHTDTLTQLLESVAIDFKSRTANIQTSLEKEERMFESIMNEEGVELKKMFADMGERTEGEYNAIIEGTKKTMSEYIENDIQKTRKALEVYRTQRLEALNSSIVSLVEDTARIALNKTLTLEEHKDLVMNSLKEAKQMGIFSVSS